MSHPIKSVIFSLVLTSIILLPFSVSAQLSIFNPFGGTAGAGDPGNANLLVYIRNIVNAFLAFAGIVAAIMMVIGGVMYITSFGEEDRARQAKMLIIYAAIGIIVILLSGVFVNFVIKSPAGS